MERQRVGVYRVEELLGEGGMGRVYRGYDQRLDRWVALKHVRPEADHPERRRRLRREARVLARLSHASIVPVFDLVESDDGDWVVMELVEGPGLDQLLAGGPLDPPQVLRLGQQIAEGLAEAHGKGILHRDLKTENVRISASGQARILDFGLAKPVTQDSLEPALSVSGQLLGTVRAMSPEQTRGAVLDERSDLFALGILLYEMATGVSPFHAASPIETLLRICSDQQEPALSRSPGLPSALSELIDELLEKAVEMRPQSAAEVADRLGQMRSEMPQKAATRSQQAFERSLAAVHTEETLVAEEPKPAVAPRSRDSVAPRNSVTARNSGSSYADVELSRRANPGSILAAVAVFGLGLLIATQIGPWADRDPTANAASAVGEGASGIAQPVPPDDPFRLQQHGWTLLERFDKKGHVDRAIGIFQQVLELDPDSAIGHAGLARATWRKYHNDGKDPQWLEQALHLAQRAVHFDEHLAAGQLSLAHALLSSGRFDDARQSFERARQLDPTSGEPWLGLGKIRSRIGDPAGAEEAFLQGLRLEQQHAELHDSLGQLYYSTSRYPEAEVAFRQSVELLPDRVFGYRNLAAALHAQGEVGAAAKQLQAALAIQPESTVYANLGTLHYFQGLYREAAEAFDKATQLGGGAHSHQIWANLGDAYRQLPNRQTETREAYDVALRLVRRELEQQPANAALESRLALYLARRGPSDEALAQLDRSETAQAAAAGDPWIAHRLALAYELSGDRDRALHWLEASLRAGQTPREIEIEPDFLGLRSDPRYQRLVATVERGP